ncbi:RB1-inducible coiled-coil protein [Rhynchospora pubera]|uniref:RB1-inducible coiled-coil protein n=1 Tax=Rhynchospora pubera TaxID=906938 RepID=A0AAV8GMG8_9POAL|nr:RB1-inducible coiled-coil protein [Rhynchospora pubera]
MADRLRYYDLLHHSSAAHHGNRQTRHSLMVTEQHAYEPAQPNKKTAVRNPVTEAMSIPALKPETRSPGIVARLMGMDTIPPGRSTVIDAKESKLPKPISYYSPRKDLTFDGSPRSAPFRQTKGSLLSYGSNTYTRNGSNISNNNSYNKNSKKDYGGSQKSKRPLSGAPPRQHPQEEELQKFKRDFKAWQSSVMVERSNGLIVENNIQTGKYIQILAQGNLNKEKMAKYTLKKQTAPKTVKVLLPKNELHVSEVTVKQEKSAMPTRIVILKPSFDPKNQIPDPFIGSSNSNNRDCTMVDFLEEVKERLRLEIEGKARSNEKKQKNGKNEIINTDPKEIARDIAKQIRETVTRDFEKKLTRSRSFKLPNYVPDTSELVRRDTRRILSEKLKNVLRSEPGSEKPSTSMEPPRASFIIKRRERVKSMSEFPSIINIEDKRNDARCKLDSAGMVDANMASPRSLFRSFSAPVSGTTLGKLLLEDSGLTKWAHVGVRHEEDEAGLREERKGRKEHGPGLKGKVSNLKQNLNLKRKLFRNKTQAVKTPNSEDFLPINVIRTIPSALVNPGTNQENYTEVPPSPASISSSSHNEFSGGNSPSPVSPLEVSSHASKPSFGDISFPISDASPTKQEGKEEETKEVEFTEKSEDTDITEILTPEKAYVKEILINAGLYENKNTYETNLHINFAPRSISMKIFEEMEEAFSMDIKTFIEEPSQISPYAEIDRRILFELANESMQTLFGPTSPSDTLCEWVATSGTIPAGRILLDEIWKQIENFCNPPMDQMQTIDCMVGRDVNMDAWTSKLYEDKDVLCKKISFVIYMELLDDFVHEMGSNL